jgi:hypothetical protein
MSDTNPVPAVDPEIEKWVSDAVDAFQAYRFVFQKGWWKNTVVGLYAAVDDHRMGHGRAAGIYAHRVDSAGTDYMQALIQIPWYGDGLDRSRAKVILLTVLDAVTSGGF